MAVIIRQNMKAEGRHSHVPHRRAHAWLMVNIVTHIHAGDDGRQTLHTATAALTRQWHVNGYAGVVGRCVINTVQWSRLLRHGIPRAWRVYRC